MVEAQSALFVVGPQTDHFDGPALFQDLVDEPVLDGDPARVGPGEIPDQLLVGRGDAEGIAPEQVKQDLSFGPQAGGGQFFRVSLGLARKDEAPCYHRSVSRHFAMGVFNPRRMDSRMPGIESR